jgi:TPR repeat protein
MLNGRRWALVAVAIALLQAFPALAGGSRVALVIGNGAYRHPLELQNPVRDAQAVAGALRGLGFEVIIGVDLDRRAMSAKLQAFGRAAEGSDIAVVFYAGHGVQVAGKNWLIPVDDTLDIDEDLRSDVVTADAVLDKAKGAKGFRLVILDACRDIPLRPTAAQTPGGPAHPITRGLAQIDLRSASNTLVVYATRAGGTAADGAGAHSPFTAAFLKQLEIPGLEINDLIRQVHDAVLANTRGDQEPAIYSSLASSPIYLNGALSHQAEISAWNAIQNSSDPAKIESLLKQFPESALRPYAENKLRRLRPPEQQRTADTTSALSPARMPETADGAHKKGEEAFKDRNYGQALQWYRQAADGGNADAMFNLGSFHMLGLGVPVDYQAAMRWFRAAADRGDVRAMNQIGALYGEGKGVQRDYAEALRWIRKAADDGEPTAMNNVGRFYRDGRGVPPDYAEAIRWFRQAAERGNTEAMVSIGFAYERGQGVPRDLAQARVWMEKAKEAGVESAETWLRDHSAATAR